MKRNPLDGAVSFYHWYKKMDYLGPYKGTWNEFFELWKNGNSTYIYKYIYI